MSKEKNLTYLYKDGVVATVATKGHQIVDEVAFSEILIQNYTRPVNGKHLQGPAIDRLHEFEKLGMEPEEIETILTDYPSLHVELKATQDDREYWRKFALLNVENGQESRDKVARLEQRLSNQAESIQNLMDENEELKKECADRERNEERLHEVIKNQNELIEQLKTNSNPEVKTDTTGVRIGDDYYVRAGLYYGLKGEKEKEIERFQGLVKMYEKEAVDALFEKMSMADEKWKLEQEIAELKKDRDAYKETAEMYRKKCIELETKPLTVEEYEDYLDDLAKKYNLTSFKSTNGSIHNVIFTDSKRLLSDKRIVFDVYIDLNNFGGSKDVMKVTENHLREKLHLEPLED